MAIRKTNWSWPAVILTMFLFPAATLTKSPAPLAARTSNAADRQEDTKQKDKKRGDAVSPQDRDYQNSDASQYVGSETCTSCHEEIDQTFKKGPHWKTNLVKHQGPQWQGCEACHGTGKEHAESADPARIIRFPGLSREEASRRCLGCHEFGEEHANFLRSQHLKNNVGCIDCHSIHHPLVQRPLLRAAQPQLCYTCHTDIKPDSSKPSHHGVDVGPVSCTNCHNPHG